MQKTKNRITVWWGYYPTVNNNNLNADEILNIDADCKMQTLTLSRTRFCFRSKISLTKSAFLILSCKARNSLTSQAKDDVCGETKSKNKCHRVIARRMRNEFVAAIQKMNAYVYKIASVNTFKFSLRFKSRNDVNRGGLFSPLITHFSLKKAFTLAEVLITLGIIGVLAALTIPALMNRINDYQNIQAWRKIYSEIAAAYELAGNESVPMTYPPDSWYGYDAETVNTILSFMRIVDSCQTGIKAVSMGFMDRECSFSDDKWLSFGTPSVYKSLTGLNFDFYNMTRKAVLTAGGATIYIGGDFVPVWGVDVNGATKGPNVIGRDVFGLTFENNRMRPMGAINTYGFSQYSPMTSYGCLAPGGSSNEESYLFRAAGSSCSVKYILEGKK